MVYKRSQMSQEALQALENKRAATDIGYAAILERRRSQAAMRATCDAIRPVLTAIKQGREAWRVVSKASTPYHEVDVYRRKTSVGARTKVYQGDSYLPDKWDLLRRASKALGIKPGSLTLPEALEWTGRVVAASGRADDKMSTSYTYDVVTPIPDARVPRLAMDKQEVRVSRDVWRAMIWSDDKRARSLAIRLKMAGKVAD